MKPFLLSSLLVAATAFAAPSEGQVLVLTNEVSAASVASVVSENIAVTVTLLRHRPTQHLPVAEEKIGDCNSLPELARVLRAAGPLEVLSHSRREVACAPHARAEFGASESRQSYIASDPAASPTHEAFGLELHADVAVLARGSATRPPVLVLSWEGSWAGSVTLLATWEKLAVRGFNIARAVPGITYTKVEPDEDGFVNTGGGTDIGGFFRKKKPKADAKKGNPPANPEASKGPAAPGITHEREPSYSAEPPPDKIPLQGQWIGPAGQMLVTRRVLSAVENSGDLYLVVRAERID